MANNNKQNQKQNQKVVVHIHDKPRRRRAKNGKSRRNQETRVMQPIIQNVILIASGLPPQGYGPWNNNQTPLPNLPPNPVSSTVYDIHHRNITDVPTPFDIHHRTITDIEATNRAAQAQNLNEQINRDALLQIFILMMK